MTRPGSEMALIGTSVFTSKKWEGMLLHTFWGILRRLHIAKLQDGIGNSCRGGPVGMDRRGHLGICFHRLESK